MAVADLIVEDGTGIDNADAYVDEQFVIDYWGNLNDPEFEGEPTESRKSAVRKATQFFDAVWGVRAPGSPTNPGDDEADPVEEPQALVFPRDGKPLPLKLKQCIAELAKMALAGPLGGNGATVAAPSASQISSMKAGSVEIAFRDRLKAAVETDVGDRFYLVEKLASSFLKSNALNTGSSR